MKVAVITFPGSNCDSDAISVMRVMLGLDTKAVWHKEARLPDQVRLVIIPGGFSYGDALRSGAIARFSPIMADIKRFADAGGLVIGICNGFQILLESGLLPGAMLQNASQKFVCRMVQVEAVSNTTPFTSDYQRHEWLRIPVAHHEGRYHADEETYRQLQRDDRIAFRYGCRDNPNGSLGDVAGIVNAQRNVLGMMPHPERAVESLLGSDDGLRLFRSAVRFAKSREG
ncbi:MAG: phosphoribosylformylglycinamidine synthase subunit PurQ [Myxococcales bacterium]|nr:phosphoribosylformylglycinamidine synthase subunit PurQ [Myxococcales bacterium]